MTTIIRCARGETITMTLDTSLPEDSIQFGGMPVTIPDFTNGKWCREYQ